MEFSYKIYSLAEDALAVQFSPQISWKLTQYMYWLKHQIDQVSEVGIRRVEITFYELIVFYDPEKLRSAELLEIVKDFLSLKAQPEKDFSDFVLHHIPVCYASGLALDARKLEKQTGMGFEEIVRRHTRNEMQVYMLGFLPGFLYLGGMDEQLACPRHEIPRKLIPEGSVGIAGLQTGIYPVDSPGGWNIIGRTPLRLFPRQKDGAPTELMIRPLDRIRFYAISEKKYGEWKGMDLHSFLRNEKGQKEWD